jgi:hypothetical protein
MRNNRADPETVPDPDPRPHPEIKALRSESLAYLHKEIAVRRLLYTVEEVIHGFADNPRILKKKKLTKKSKKPNTRYFPLFTDSYRFGRLRQKLTVPVCVNYITERRT